MNTRHAVGCTAALSLALALSTAYAADDSTTSTGTSSTTTQAPAPMTGKDKATAIGAGSGAVAGAVVGGPIGAVVGAGIGAVVGHEGTDANGHVTTATRPSDSTVRSAQTALNDRGYNVGVDGRWGPNTESAVRSFQAKNGLTENGRLDSATLNALGVTG
jgi:peptidoglycan hydrolase-like protein with peptidoglycan-binding domain